MEFPEDEGQCPIIGIISSSWIFELDGNIYCYWPKYFKNDSTRDKAIKDHNILKINDCDTCPIIVKYKTDSYEKARKMLKNLEEHSQVEDSSDDEKRKKRNIMKKTHLDFVDSLSDIEDTPPIPKIPAPKKKTQAVAVTTINLQNRKLTNVQDRVSLSTHKEREGKGERCVQCLDNKRVLTEMFEQLAIIKENINFLIGVCGRQAAPNDIPTEIIQLTTFADLETFNEELSDQTKFSEACKWLSCVGGKDVGETTRKILTKLISNQLAVNSNWTGRNNKNGLKELRNFINLILVSVRKNPICSNALLDNVEQVIKSWLRTAYDRDGGRSRRKRADEN